MLKYLLTACLVALPLTANSALISVDWKTTGDDLITRDTVSGFEWLDLTETVNRSYSDISSQLGIGGEFEGWRYGTLNETQILLANHGFPYINPNFNEVSNQRTENVSYYISFLDLFGETCPIGVVNCNQNLTQTRGWIDGPTNSSVTELVYDHLNNDAGINFFNTSPGAYIDTGSFLVRSTVVPIPAALWLFGSGLIGLIGLARRKPSH